MAENLEEIISSSMAQSATDLEGKIEASPNDEGVAGGGEELEASSSPSDDSSKEPKSDEVDEFGLNRYEQTQARQLLSALKDPNKAGEIIAWFAQHGGYEKPTTQKEAIKQAASMADELKEALGPQLEYLAEKMGPVFERRLKKEVEDAKTEASARISRIEQEKLENNFNDVQRVIAKKYFNGDEIPEKIASTMLDVMDNYSPGKNQSPEDYMEEILHIAARRSKVELKSISSQKKIERNRNDAPSRLASDGRAASPRVFEMPQVRNTKPMTLADSVAKAMSDIASNS